MYFIFLLKLKSMFWLESQILTKNNLFSSIFFRDLCIAWEFGGLYIDYKL